MHFLFPRKSPRTELPRDEAAENLARMPLESRVEALATSPLPEHRVIRKAILCQWLASRICHDEPTLVHKLAARLFDSEVKVVAAALKQSLARASEDRALSDYERQKLLAAVADDFVSKHFSEIVFHTQLAQLETATMVENALVKSGLNRENLIALAIEGRESPFFYLVWQLMFPEARPDLH
jgi:hypothetical protein